MLIVDDDSWFRLIAREMLTMGGFDVLGEACSVSEAITAARGLDPDVVLLDVHLPDGDGFSAARHLTRSGTRPTVVLCSVAAAEDFPVRSDDCGAVGFVTKSRLSADAVLEAVAA